jgi:hypothetical protein
MSSIVSSICQNNPLILSVTYKLTVNETPHKSATIFFAPSNKGHTHHLHTWQSMINVGHPGSENTYSDESARNQRVDGQIERRHKS